MTKTKSKETLPQKNMKPHLHTQKNLLQLTQATKIILKKKLS